ncbi:16S rRNA (adenine(1518)-N(6)/adenine(1519)-N(6))-dimethyltransferase RsmA [Albibacterium indicum]|uniref:16S rRNA (adenine(1518)-N(6)/adenine(1519)-N(6))- dimethyltransferase RsmA n=1 Tax=Albibacterium indicum TaxID=2292082 RepID=UPI000E4E244E|nr:16S rRNA (adenine(1518)-N(6)/adenine(1519)-N(6))-dimethyltransferase RsmA [Pedobacter indicus]
MAVQAKKHLGQHFLTDRNAARKIVDALQFTNKLDAVIEVGPGMGVLSDFLIEKKLNAWFIDIDEESIQYLEEKYPDQKPRLILGDFLSVSLEDLIGSEKVAVIGNFPYNISSQILFKILEERNRVVEVVGMFQKEVAQRCTAQPGTKEYGILSVLLQAYYDIKYLFTVKAGSFNPPPKVLSGVIRLVRNPTPQLDCDEKLFKQVVKAGFNQRRKTLRNALSALIDKDKMNGNRFMDLRAERLSVEDFIALTKEITESRINHE